MSPQFPKRFLTIFLIGATLLLGGYTYWYFFTFHIVSVTPGNKKMTPSSTIQITFNKSIKNADAINDTSVINPSNIVVTIVDDKTIRLTPIAAYTLDTTYTVTIPEVVADDGKTLKNITQKFTVSASNSNEEEDGISQDDIDAYVRRKYPYIDKLIDTSDVDHTITYGFPNDVFTIMVDIQPYLPPNDRLVASKREAKIIEVYNRFVANLKTFNVGPKDVPMQFTPDEASQVVNRVR